MYVSSDGRFSVRIDGKIPITNVYVQQELWEKDWLGATRLVDLGDKEWAIVQVALLTGDWSRDDGLLVFESKPAAESKVAFRLRGGVLEGTIELDDGMHPVRVVTTTVGAEYIAELDGFVDEPVVHPARMTVRGPYGNTSSIRIDTLSASLSAPADTFDIPAADNTYVTWDTKSGAAIKTSLSRTGHHLVRALVDGEDLGWFIFDSGASVSAQSESVIQKMQLTILSTIQVAGIGGSVESQVVRADSLRVGPLTLHEPLFVSLDLSTWENNFGVTIAGIVGYDVMSRAVVRVVPRQPIIEMFPLGKDPHGANWIDCILPNRVPAVTASVEGHEGYYTLDTGAALATVDFRAPAVQRLALLQDRRTRRDSAGGVGGRTPTRAGTVETFELAGKTWKNLAVEFSLADVGSFADPYTDGNIGGRVLKHFELWFDYTNSRIGFVPLKQGE